MTRACALARTRANGLQFEQRPRDFTGVSNILATRHTACPFLR
jgi:hypothetical protein